jgi:hypothetical protein
MQPVARAWSTSARICNLSGPPMIRLDGLTKTSESRLAPF